MAKARPARVRRVRGPSSPLFQKGDLVILIEPFDFQEAPGLSSEFYVTGSLLKVVIENQYPGVAIVLSSDLTTDFEHEPEAFQESKNKGFIAFASTSRIIK